MKNKTLIVLLLISSLFTGVVSAGDWFIDIPSGRDSRYHQSASNYNYAYRMGSNYNNGIGPRPVYPVKTIIYTPWVRHMAPVPEHLYKNLRAIVREYGSFYEVCYANYQY